MSSAPPPPLSHIELPRDGGRLFVPSDRLPLIREIQRPGRWRFDAGNRVFLERPGDSDQNRLAIHPDLFLEACRLDLDAPEEIVAFLDRYGPLGLDPTIRSDLGRVALRSTLWNRRESFFGSARMFDGDRHQLEDERLRLRAADLRRDPGAVHGYEPLEAFRSGVVTLRLLVDTWWWMRREARAPAPPLGLEPGEASEVLAVILEDALSVFSPRFSWVPPEDRTEGLSSFSDAPLFCILCLQIARRIVAGDRVQHCRFCAQPFYTTWRDPGAIKRSRSDRQFCSDRCRFGHHNQRKAENRRRRAKRAVASLPCQASGEHGSS